MPSGGLPPYFAEVLQRSANICSRLTYSGVQVMSFGIKCLCAAAIKRKRKQRSAKVKQWLDISDGQPSELKSGAGIWLGGVALRRTLVWKHY